MIQSVSVSLSLDPLNFVFKRTRLKPSHVLFCQYKAGDAQLATWPEPFSDLGFLNGSVLSMCLMRVLIAPFDGIQNTGLEPPCKRIDLRI